MRHVCVDLHDAAWVWLYVEVLIRLHGISMVVMAFGLVGSTLILAVVFCWVVV